MRAFTAGVYDRMKRRPGLSAFLAALVVTLVMELCSHRSFVKLAVFAVTRPHILLYNVCIVWWTFSLLLLVRRRLFLGAFLSIVWVGLGLTDFVLQCFRVTPFSAADLRLTGDAVKVAGKYLEWWHVVLLAAAAILLLAALAVLFKKLPRSRWKPMYVRDIIFIVFCLFALFGINSAGTYLGVFESQFGNLADAYRDYGFAYCFANSVLNTGIKKPADYSEEAVQEIREEEIVPETHGNTHLIAEAEPQSVADSGIAATRNTPNILFLQLESFCDPTLWEHVAVSEDPIPNYHALMEAYSSGYLWVPAVGAGTANTEFEVITGMNLDFFGPGEYPYKTVLQTNVCESMAFDLKELGYHAQAIHNNTGTFYDRHTVFSQLGFDTFIPIEYMYGYDTTYTGWAKDSILIRQIANALDYTTGADYIYTISVQGHGAYPEEQVLENVGITVSGAEDDAEKNAMEYYIAQISEMDAFVAELTAYLDARGEPTVLVMYGDHLPSLDLTDEKLANGDQFQTQYVIWDNIGLSRETENVQAYQLSAYVLNLLGIQQGTMFRYHQGWLQGDTHTEEEEESYLSDMKMLEYDILYGKQDVFDGEMPYEATQLQMGVKPILITDVLEQAKGIYVLGWNFTTSSVICVNGKACETNCVSQNLLYTTDYTLKEEEENEITVSQVSSDNVILGTTDAFIFESE